MLIGLLKGSRTDAVAPGGRALRHLGATLILLGVIAVLLPRIATIATEWLIGAALLVSGLLAALPTIATRRMLGWRGTGVVAVIALLTGGFLLIAPQAAGRVLTGVLVVLCLLEGALYCAVALGRIHRGSAAWGFGWMLASGVISLFLGIAIVARWPASASWAIGLLVGVKLVTSGAALLLFAALVDLGEPPAARCDPLA